MTFFGKSIEETSTEIIQRTARELAAKGPELLEQYMTEKMWLAYLANPAIGSRFVGRAVHEGVAAILEDLYPKRFQYYRKGPDFLDTLTGQRVELTTPGQLQPHKIRYKSYKELEYATYEINF